MEWSVYPILETANYDAPGSDFAFQQRTDQRIAAMVKSDAVALVKKALDSAKIAIHFDQANNFDQAVQYYEKVCPATSHGGYRVLHRPVSMPYVLILLALTVW